MSGGSEEEQKGDKYQQTRYGGEEITREERRGWRREREDEVEEVKGKLDNLLNHQANNHRSFSLSSAFFPDVVLWIR